MISRTDAPATPIVAFVDPRRPARTTERPTLLDQTFGDESSDRPNQFRRCIHVTQPAARSRPTVWVTFGSCHHRRIRELFGVRNRRRSVCDGDVEGGGLSVMPIDFEARLKLVGSPMAANTTNRIRIIARASVQSAIDAGAIAADAWPAAVQDARATQGCPHRTERRRSRAAEPGRDGGGHRRDRHAAARQQDVPGDSGGRVLRRLAAVSGRDAASPIRRAADDPRPDAASTSPKRTSRSTSPANPRPDRAVCRSRRPRRDAARVGKAERPHVS